VSKCHRDLGWVHFANQKRAEHAAVGYRVRHVVWDGPGWYHLRSYTQRCPRN